uniref:Uncharacterized protein n=1 Tax=Helianthus annuus TaxID=4232 RepID=A0A251TD75_HELAN
MNVVKANDHLNSSGNHTMFLTTEAHDAARAENSFTLIFRSELIGMQICKKGAKLQRLKD